MTSRGSRRDRDPPRDSADFDPMLRARFDALLNRRVRLTHAANDEVTLFARVDGDPITSVRVLVDGRRELVEFGEATERGHRIDIVVEQSQRHPLRAYPVLEFERRSGSATRLALPQPGEETRSGGIAITTERWDSEPPHGQRQAQVRAALWTAHAALLRVVSVVGLGAAIALALGVRNRSISWSPAWGAIALIAVWVVSRIALLTVIDASSFAARSSRYIYPVASLYTCGLVLLIDRVWDERNQKTQKRR